MATKKKEATLEENFAELDAMLAKLADRDVPLEESFTIYAEGMKLLDKVEKKMLVMNEEGKLDEF